MWTRAAEVFLNISTTTTPVIQATAHQLFPGSCTHHFLLQQQSCSRPYGFPRQRARQQSGHPLHLRPFATWIKFSFRNWPSITKPPVIDSESWQAKLRGHLRTVGSGRYFCHWACLAKELRRNGGKHPKLSWGQNEDAKNTRGVCLCIKYTGIRECVFMSLNINNCEGVYQCISSKQLVADPDSTIVRWIAMVSRGCILMTLMILWRFSSTTSRSKFSLLLWYCNIYWGNRYDIWYTHHVPFRMNYNNGDHLTFHQATLSSKTFNLSNT